MSRKFARSSSRAPAAKSLHPRLQGATDTGHRAMDTVQGGRMETGDRVPTSSRTESGAHSSHEWKAAVDNLENELQGVFALLEGKCQPEDLSWKKSWWDSVGLAGGEAQAGDSDPYSLLN